MNILQICTKPPVPPVDGGCLAMNNITQGLINAGLTVKVLAITTDKHPLQKEDIPTEYMAATSFESRYIDTKPKAAPAMASMLTGESYHVQRFYSKEFEHLIQRTLQQNSFDIIQLESLFATPYLETIRAESTAKVVLRAHNVEHNIWQKTTGSTSNPISAVALRTLTRQLKEYEIDHLNDFDGIAAIRHDDMQAFKDLGCSKPITDIPFGIDITDYASEMTAKPNTVFHIGAMDWLPNQQGIDWFLEEVWPLVIGKVSNAELHLAGRKTSKEMLGLEQPGVHVHGEVESATHFMHSHAIMVVPLHSGSGLRVKIIEGMACGKPIVATNIGASGIHCTHDKDIMLADDADSLAAALIELLNSPSKAEQLGSNARQLAAEYYDNRAITQRLVSFYNELLGR